MLEFEICKETLSRVCAMWSRVWFDVFELSGCKSLYDSMRKAVRTAENKPAYDYYMSVIILHCNPYTTHKREQCIDIFVVPLHHVLVQVCHEFLADCPTSQSCILVPLKMN